MAEEKNEQVKNEEVEEKVEETSAEDVKTEKEEKTQPQKEASVPYDRFQQVIEEKNDYKNKLEQLQKDLEQMEDPEELKTKYKQQLEEVQQKTVKSKKEYALKTKALEEGVRKEALDDIVKVADLKQLTVNDNEDVEGVEELVSSLKENKSFFFNVDNSKKESKAGEDFKGNNDYNDDDKRNLKKFFGIN